MPILLNLLLNLLLEEMSSFLNKRVAFLKEYSQPTLNGVGDDEISHVPTTRTEQMILYMIVSS